MPLENISLRKLLKIGFATPNFCRSELRKVIREDQARLAGSTDEGGDFYGPFWADAKAHVFGTLELHEAVADRIASNKLRANLYPRLRDGFLHWWTDQRRRTNEPFQPGPSQRTRFEIPDLAAMVKVDNVLSIEDGTGARCCVYPYFFPDPEIQDGSAQIGLWLLTQALPEVPHHEFRLLDVIRGVAFSIEQTPLRGDEDQRFHRLYAGLIEERDRLRRTPE